MTARLRSGGDGAHAGVEGCDSIHSPAVVSARATRPLFGRDAVLRGLLRAESIRNAAVCAGRRANDAMTSKAFLGSLGARLSVTLSDTSDARA
jgi:hypothetical protein